MARKEKITIEQTAVVSEMADRSLMLDIVGLASDVNVEHQWSFNQIQIDVKTAYTR